jgi:hypothetical protein
LLRRGGYRLLQQLSAFRLVRQRLRACAIMFHIKDFLSRFQLDLERIVLLFCSVDKLLFDLVGIGATRDHPHKRELKHLNN